MRQCQNGSNWIHFLSRFTSQPYLDLCTAESVLCQTFEKYTFERYTSKTYSSYLQWIPCLYVQLVHF